MLCDAIERILATQRREVRNTKNILSDISGKIKYFERNKYRSDSSEGDQRDDGGDVSIDKLV